MEDQPSTVRRVTDEELGGYIAHLSGRGTVTREGALDLALDLADERAQTRHQADVRRALAATARAMGDQVRKAQA